MGDGTNIAGGLIGLGIGLAVLDRVAPRPRRSYAAPARRRRRRRSR